jgi:Prenyltransferase and squalene oxidase repeat
MKTIVRISLVIITTIVMTGIFLIVFQRPESAKAGVPKGCVFRTVFGEDSSEDMYLFNTPEKLAHSIDNALHYVVKAQQENGGWGAGTHAAQNIMDPHAVKTDPATTSMVLMAILRSGSTLSDGEYSEQLKNGLNYLLDEVENSDENSSTITTLTGTQIQVKLGANIDVVLGAQCLSNILDYIKDGELNKRVRKALQVCVNKIQSTQTANGSFSGNGWAGVLQSSFASAALEAAKDKGVEVDEKALEKAQDYQKNNYDTKTGDVKTDMGAGVVLYSISSTARNTSVDAKKVKEDLKRAHSEGKIDAVPQEVTTEKLREIGYNDADAEKYSTSYNVYNAAKATAQQDRVMNGFGSNGGEEFLSFLQTGESMIINKDSGWKDWYENVSGKLVSIQNEDGSWNGHHCITSPVFCTATSLLILSVNNDVEKLMRVGEK